MTNTQPLNIVLVEPEIPQNTGNIARTCAATGSALHLVRPLGFSVDDKHLKRAGLDYWHMLKIFYYDSFEELKQNFPDKDFFFSTTKSDKWFTQMRYTSGCFLVFGKETAGLPETLLHANWDRCMRLPMREGARSLNLSNSVAVAVYEALRQLDFPGLQ